MVGNRKRYDPSNMRVAAERVAWLKMGNMTVIRRDKSEDHIEVEMSTTRQKFVFTPTAWTAEQLRALIELLVPTLEVALEIAERLDKEAQDEYERGDDSNYRLYTTPPQLVDRTGGKYKHGPVLHLRSAPLSKPEPGGRGDAAQRADSGDGGEPVVDEPPEDLEGQDDVSPAE